MRDAVGEAGVGRLTAEMEVGLARMAHRPLADAVVQVEQAGLVGDLGARLGGHEATRRRGRDRRLLVARALANEAARADRAILDLGTALARLLRSGVGRLGRSGSGSDRSGARGFRLGRSGLGSGG